MPKEDVKSPEVVLPNKVNLLRGFIAGIANASIDQLIDDGGNIGKIYI